MSNTGKVVVGIGIIALCIIVAIGALTILGVI